MSIELFNPYRARLTSLVAENKGFTIQGIEDKEGYLKAKEIRKAVRDEEIIVEKLAKSEREDALAYQKGVIKLEKELLGITQELKSDLDIQISNIDTLLAREERKVLLPDRIKALKEIEVELSEEAILDLDEKKWAEFYSKCKLDYLEAKEEERKKKEKEKEEADEKERIRLAGIEEGKQQMKDELAAEFPEIEEGAVNEILTPIIEMAGEKISEQLEEFLLSCGMPREKSDDFFVRETRRLDGKREIAVFKKVNSIII